ncbi:MAG: hypothetical protein JWP69_685 [Flaviaesturariibacter sp.]|nr:hypothetical protein [Flaviaesturariibacter sp.]
MKKTTGLLLVISLVGAPLCSLSQVEMASSKIATIARFKNAAVELRWIADNKTILQAGFANSYTIERADFGKSDFREIATVKTAPRTAWDSLLAVEKNPETKSNLELAADFLFADKKEGLKELNLDKGIGELQEQRSKEDLTYAVFVLTTIKDEKVAQALGLAFIDKSAKEGMHYTYRVKLNATSSVYDIENGLVNIKAVTDTNRYKNEVAVFPGDKKLTFVWTAKREISGYYVERAKEDEGLFKPLNKAPFYDMKGGEEEGVSNGSYNDDSLINYQTYQYRFYGITSFGEKVLFAECKGMPRDLTPPDAPILKQPKHVKPKEVAVAWDIYGDTKDLKGFIVARSDKDTGRFKIIHKALLPKQTRNFTDTGFNAEENNYYIVYALDTAGNISSSFPGYVALIDSTPPAQPKIVSAVIDTLGVVTIRVRQGVEKDLKGYRIFKANSAEHELSVIQEAFKMDKADTIAIRVVFTDTVSLNSLTSKIYYKVKALDYSYNQSPFSEMVAITKPDTIPPTTPVFTRVIVTEKQVELYFAPSESVDVKEQVVYRKTDAEGEWKILLQVNPAAKQVIDTNVRTGTTYYYSIRAVDGGNLYSGYANMVYGKPYDNGVRPPVIGFSSSLREKKAMLQWQYPPIGKEVFFVIYKRDKKGKLVQYARVKEQAFTDSSTGKENAYAIKALTADGGQSVLSAIITQKGDQ